MTRDLERSSCYSTACQAIDLHAGQQITGQDAAAAPFCWQESPWRPVRSRCRQPQGRRRCAIQHGEALMRDNKIMFAPATATQVLRTRHQGRLPSSLDELTGPAHGVVQLPAHVAWSGLTSYDLDGGRSCMTLYRTVLSEGQRDDLSELLNRDLLLTRWPILRNLISRNIREVGYTVQAHGLVNRLSRDLDVATQSPARMEAIADALAAGLAARGWARTWSDDIAERISEHVDEDDLP